MNGADLLLEGIRKAYAVGPPAVDDVSLAVEEGQFLTLLGPSGCGKTTLLRIIAGFVSPTTGRVIVRGNDVTSLSPQRRPTAMVFQNYALFPHMTAAENVAFGLSVRGVSKTEIAERVKKMLMIVGLGELADRYPGRLSGGQQQRVAMARALAVEPPVLLMDEPLGALDAKLREEMQFELRSIQRRLGITTVYVTHDQEEAFNLADQVAVMSRGRLLQVGTPEAIYQHPNCGFVARFVGKSTIIRGTVNGDKTRFVTSEGKLLAITAASTVASGVPAILVVRPEDISIGESNGAENVLEGRIEHRRSTGSGHLYYVRTDVASMVLAEAKKDTALSAGMRVLVSWRGEQSIVLPDDGQTH
jgi:spermidine/putrescine ABC transporter ATP-binding subunit